MTDWARRVMDEVDGALPPVTDEAVWAEAMADPAFVEAMERGRADFEAGRVVPYRHIVPRDARTGYATENVVPVTTAEQDATLEWIEAINWATGEDVR